MPRPVAETGLSRKSRWALIRPVSGAAMRHQVSVSNVSGAGAEPQKVERRPAGSHRRQRLARAATESVAREARPEPVETRPRTKQSPVFALPESATARLASCGRRTSEQSDGLFDEANWSD